MERAVALKRLSKMFGKKLRWQINPKAPTAEEREAARIEMATALPEKKALEERLSQRRAAILAADQEYRELLALFKAMKERVDKLQGMQHRHKIQVMTFEGFFNHVRASGDSWEEIFAELEKRVAA